MTLQKRLDRNSKAPAVEVAEDYYVQRPADQTPRYSAR